MQPAENKDYSRDVILRLSPTRNTIIVEEQKPGGIAAYREIDPLELYYVINQSYASNDYLDSGFLPEHCLHLSMSATEKYFVLWNPELRADVIYGDKEYPNFPIPRMVFGVRVLENGKVAECSMGVVADEAPTMDKVAHLAARSRRPIDALVRPHDLHLFTLIWLRTGLLVAIAVHDIYIAIIFSGSVMTDGFHFIGSYGHCSFTS